MSDEADEYAEVPSAEERAWLVGELAVLVDACGAAPFAEAPIVEPTDSFFPDPWTKDETGVQRLVERALILSGLQDVQVVIDLECPLRDEPFWIESLDEETCRIGLAQLNLSDPVGYAAIIAGAVFREVNGLAAEADAPRGYRERPKVDPELAALEAKRVEVAEIYLGFGVIAANHCLTFDYVEGTARIHGVRNAVRTPSLRKTALPPVCIGYGLAVQAAVRSMGFWDRSKLADQLESRARGYFKASWKLVADDAASLRERLGAKSDEPTDA